MGEWDYIVRIVLVEGVGLLSMDDNGLSDPYVRFKLQNEKYKSKVCIIIDISLPSKCDEIVYRYALVLGISMCIPASCS